MTQTGHENGGGATGTTAAGLRPGAPGAPGAPAPQLTVVVAAYNAAAHVGRAIASVQAQDMADWELICVDDGSTDGTFDVVKDLAAADPRIRGVRQENAGHPEARRVGYTQGHGMYYIMLDSDDWVAPDFLSSLVEVAERENADAVMSDMQTLGPDGDWESFAGTRGLKQGDVYDGVEAFALTFPWRAHGVCLWRGKLIRDHALDPVDTRNRFNGDEYLTRKLFLNCARVVVGPGKYFYESNPESLTRKPSPKHLYRLETNRRLTELARAAAVPQAVLARVIAHEGKGILESVKLLARYGMFRRAGFALRELAHSCRHYAGSLAASNSLHKLPAFVFKLVLAVLRGFFARFALLRSAQRALRRPAAPGAGKDLSA